MNNDVETLKAEERYHHAGSLAYIIGQDKYYGCHYGMRSKREIAIFQFEQGWEEARQADARSYGGLKKH